MTHIVVLPCGSSKLQQQGYNGKENVRAFFYKHVFCAAQDHLKKHTHILHYNALKNTQNESHTHTYTHTHTPHTLSLSLSLPLPILPLTHSQMVIQYPLAKFVLLVESAEQ